MVAAIGLKMTGLYNPPLLLDSLYNLQHSILFVVVVKILFGMCEWSAFFAPVAPAVLTLDALWVLVFGEIGQDLIKLLLLHPPGKDYKKH